MIVTSERLNIYKKMFSPVENQVIFLSKETTIVSVGLRKCWGTLHEPKQNGVKIEVWQMLGQPLHICVDFPMRKRVILIIYILSSIQITLKCLTFRQFICPLSLFLKEISFASFTNAIDLKIERVLTGFLIGRTIF